MKRATVTVLKADISGSTPLAERLDPEELRGILSAYFAALANQIQRHGGSVDKYIGDAVMAVFGLPEARPDDAVRATQAALGMVDAIVRENEALAARYGVRLSLRVGLATGVLTASEDAELTLMGDVVSAAESMEAAAPLNSVLMSASARAAASGHIRSEPGPMVRIKGAGASVPSFRPMSDGSDVAGEGATVTRARGSASLQVAGHKVHVLQEERKIVTVLFADVVVTSGALASDAIRPVLNAYFGDVVREIQHYGGTIDKYIGDAVMAVFGAPISHDDDGARAISAGLGLQAALARRNAELERDHGVRLAARVGVNTGEVVAGLLAGDVVAYTVTGDTVNTAQRIESAAQPGEVLVSESTRDLARHAFLYEAVAPLTLKGKSQPVPAYRVLAADTSGVIEGPALVGRAAELAWLADRFADAAAGSGRLAHIGADAGVGKTRLVTEFLARVPVTTKRLRAHMNSYETATPYALVAEVVRRSFGIASADDAASASRSLRTGLELFAPGERAAAEELFLEILGYGEHSSLGPEQKRRLLASLIRGLVERLADPAAVVVLEDIHWIDAASDELFATVAAGIPSLRVLLLTTSRDETLSWAAERLPLQPLDASAATAMIDSAAGTTLDPATRALVLERTGGNPFFIEEVVRAMRAGGDRTVPATVQDVLEARLDGLDEAPRLVAHRAAIIGRTFALPLLARVLPNTDLLPALAELVAQRVVSPGESRPEQTYSFSHALVHEVAYRTQLIAQRRRIHVGVGDAISALYEGRLEEFVDVLAYQYGSGEDDAKARAALVRAGRRAQRLYAKKETVNYFEQAIGRSPDDRATRADAEEAIGDIERVTGGYEAALARYAAAMAERRDDLIAVPRLTRKGAIVQQLRGDQAHAAQIYREVLAALPRDAHEERAQTLLNIAEASWRQGHYDEAAAQLEEAITEAAGAEAIAAEAFKQLGTVASHKGELDRALAYFERSLAAYKKEGDALGQANVHNNIGVLERTRSRHDAALAAYASALAIRERIGDQLGRVHSLNNMGRIHYLRGHLAPAIDAFAAALEIARSIGYALGVGATLEAVGASRVAQGDVDAGLRDLRAGVAEIERAGSLPNLVDALCDLANAYAGQRSPDALTTAERAVAIARDLKLPERSGIALQALGRARLALGDTEGALRALEESRTLLEPLAQPQELARTLAVLGRLYLADPAKREAGADLLDQARATFTRLGADLDLRRMEEPIAS